MRPRPNRIGHRISDKALSLSDLPSRSAGWPSIAAFAVSMDGYRRWRGFDRCAEIGNEIRAEYAATRALPPELSRLRTALFFEQRRFHHFGEAPGGEDLTYVRALVNAIRAAVASRPKH